MKKTLLSRSLAPLPISLLVAVFAGFLTVLLTYHALKDNFADMVNLQVQRDADILTRITLTGNAMGAVSALGLVNPIVKSVLKDEAAVDDIGVMETLQSIHDVYGATAAFIVKPDGLVQSNFVSLGPRLNNDDVSFRPYFKRAMKGEKNVYVAIGTSTGLRSFFAAAPIYETQSVKSRIIGVAVLRMPDDQLGKIISRSTVGDTFLLSPQNVVFSSNQKEWFGHMAVKPTASELTAIRDLKQFGKSLMDNQVKLLPFDILRDSVNYDDRSFLVSRATVDWGDPNGDWKLVMMADLDFLMPFNYKLTVGLGSAFGFFLITLMMLQWRAKLQHAKYKRFKAEEEVKVYTTRLETESESKSFLSDLTLNFQQTTNHIDFAKVLISNVTPRLTAAYVALYARHTDTKEFHPIGCYGVIENTLKAFELGHGMLGQVAKEGQTLMLDDISTLPIVIQSGLGYNKPKAVLLIPIKQSDDVLGVMVVASLKGFNATQLAFQEALQPLMAGQLNVLNRNVSFATRTDN